MLSRKRINTLSFAAVLLINALAELLPIGGRTTGEVSKAYPNLFTPAPYAFAIWGLIYLLLALWVWRAERSPCSGAAGESESAGGLFALSCLFNAAWIFCWHYDDMVLSFFCIIGLLVCLIEIQKRLGSAGTPARTAFGLYLGWIIAATIANAAVMLTKLGWGRWGLSETFWTVLMLLLGALITVLTERRFKNPAIAAAVLWAYVAIFARHFLL